MHVALSVETPNRNVGPARIRCVDALFSLIGSMAYRKDAEVALVAGEALANYADAYSPNNVIWSVMLSAQKEVVPQLDMALRCGVGKAFVWCAFS